MMKEWNEEEKALIRRRIRAVQGSDSSNSEQENITPAGERNNQRAVVYTRVLTWNPQQRTPLELQQEYYTKLTARDLSKEQSKDVGTE